MSKYCHVVPWYNSAEWQKVYEELSDSTSSKEYALHTLLVWKARCPTLPSGIESTLCLLQVHVEDNRQEQSATNNELLRLAYSSAIMRFVNHMLDTETVKGTSLYMAAKNLGVPDWIIDLRHDTAHSNNLPNISLLREACAISLLWLQHNYWDKYKVSIQDFITGQKCAFYKNENKIAVLIDLLTALSICAHPNCKIKNLSKIPDIDMRESIINDVKDLFGEYIDVSNLKTVSILTLINIINKQGQDLLNLPNVTAYVNEAILGEDAIFLSRDLLYHFSANDFKHKSRLNNNYVQCFEVLLTFLHTNDSILEFIEALIKITQDSETEYFKARLAALWVSEILAALKRSQEFHLKLNKMNPERKRVKKKQLKQLFHHWFPNTKTRHLFLDLKKPAPEELMDINYVRPIITAYNTYLIYFIRNLLNLVEPPIPAETAERVYKLAKLISTPEKFLSNPSTRIYTADDIELSSDFNQNDNDVVIVDDSSENTDAQVDNAGVDNHVNSNCIWKLACENQNWSLCPIGQLPWQQKAISAMET